MHDLVALLQDFPTTHFETGRPLMLRRGQIGTIMMTYGDGATGPIDASTRKPSSSARARKETRRSRTSSANSTGDVR